MELPMGPRSAVLGVADACGHTQWGLRWSSFGATKCCTSCGGRMWYPHGGLAWSLGATKPSTGCG
eukprot:3163568-Pyramimonas_sp.AAC.1